MGDGAGMHLRAALGSDHQSPGRPVARALMNTEVWPPAGVPLLLRMDGRLKDKPVYDALHGVRPVQLLAEDQSREQSWSSQNRPERSKLRTGKCRPVGAARNQAAALHQVKEELRADLISSYKRY
ncbi:hypothetical protein NDU88_009023 [Pleurodeles waltl]|uniref:Uncharacterized protein n=1 Tax=Pleurodeles waltl TaxID=8319 RepID=A0AAV7QRQ0_PLEWA|nr:hypothetical protein NDU88_009023 [Pleurodeles waltl]